MSDSKKLLLMFLWVLRETIPELPFYQVLCLSQNVTFSIISRDPISEYNGIFYNLRFFKLFWLAASITSMVSCRVRSIPKTSSTLTKTKTFQQIVHFFAFLGLDWSNVETRKIQGGNWQNCRIVDPTLNRQH